jgi:N-acetylmuramic acid 6-phosphate etherase
VHLVRYTHLPRSHENLTMPPPVVELAGLQTENRNPRSANIDRVSTEELCRILNREDSQVPKAVEPHIPVIAEAIEVLTERVRKGGRVFYIGAGTSGR